MNTVRTVTKNTLALTSADIANKFISLLLIIYVARYLGDVDFGKYSFALAFSNFFLIFADMGLNYLIIRDVARDRSLAGRYLGNVLIIKSVLMVIVIGMMIVALELMNYPMDTSIVVYIVCFSLIIGSLSGSFHSIISAFEQMEFTAITSIIERITFVGLGLAVIFSGYGLIPFVLMFLISNLTGFLLSGLIVYKKFTRPIFEIDYGFWKYLLRSGFPFLLTGMFATIYFYIDTIMLSVMKGDAVVGWYNAAYNLLAALIPILALFMSAMFPVFSKFFKTSENSLAVAFTASIRYIFMFTLPIVIGTTLLSENIIFFLYGTVFIESILTLQILIWALLFISMSLVLSTFLNSTDGQMLVTKTTAIGAFINVILNLILIPIMSLTGASIATLITEGSLFITYYYFVSKHRHFVSIHRMIYKPIFAVVAMGAFVIFMRDANIFITITFAAFIYTGVLFVIKGFTIEDIDMFKQVVGKEK